MIAKPLEESIPLGALCELLHAFHIWRPFTVQGVAPD